MELSIDTSNKHASIGLSEEGKLIIDKTWISKNNHSVELLPSIEKIIKKIEKKFSDINCIFIASGPGKFSSLRVGMSIAKGLAISLKSPISAINTLYLEGYPELIENKETNSLMEYNKDKFYIGQFKNINGQIKSEYLIADQSALYNLVSENSFICGEGISSLSKDFYDKLKKRTKYIKLKSPGSRIIKLAKLGFENHKNKNYCNTSTLQPMYLGNSQITKTKIK
ncbi:MAG: tRNA (adenosine(37)-N6)-threonylcarbamoyltransferase complex dimerization subunit type 1 TsaB [Dehalococcoidia bacterium]